EKIALQLVSAWTGGGGHAWTLAGRGGYSDYAPRRRNLTEQDDRMVRLAQQAAEILAQPAEDARAGGVDRGDRQPQLRADVGRGPIAHRRLPERLPGGRLKLGLHQPQRPSDEVAAILVLLHLHGGVGLHDVHRRQRYRRSRLPLHGRPAIAD